MAAIGKPHSFVAAPALVRSSTLGASLHVEICTPAIGADIGNVDLADVGRDKGLAAEIRSLWLRHKVLFFRDQHISPIERQRCAEAFGELEPHPSLAMHPDAPMLLPLYRNLDPGKPNAVERASRENIWHSDVTYKKIASRGAMLSCEVCPDCGGDTMWANMALAYERLPERIKAKIDGLYAMHSMDQLFAAQAPLETRRKAAAATPAVEHPVVMKHPETGEKVLFVNQAFTTHFTNFYNFDDVRFGQDFRFEANHLLNYLVSQPAIPEYQVRLKWRPGTVALWDNLLTQHYAVADYGDAPRKMLRATFKGAA